MLYPTTHTLSLHDALPFCPAYQPDPRPVAAVAADRPLSSDHRQPRADRFRGRVRERQRHDDHVPRHPAPLLVRRRGDRLHPRGHQLEGSGTQIGRASRRERVCPPPPTPLAPAPPTTPHPPPPPTPNHQHTPNTTHTPPHP